MKFSFVLALAIVLNLASDASAQNVEAAEVARRQTETPSRPTLRRRQRKPHDESGTQQVSTEDSNTLPCDKSPSDSNITTAQNEVRIEFEGLIAVNESDLRMYLRDQRINRALDSALDSASIAKAEKAIKNLLSDYGYRRAAVSSRLEKNPIGSPSLTFVISEGPHFKISDIRFGGNRVFSELLLTTKLKECLAQYDNEKRNRSYVFEYCTHALTNFERSQGYLKAKFAPPQIEEVGEGLIIIVKAEEGSLYRLGRIEIEGADHVAEEHIRALLDIHAGDIANGEKISKALYEDLKVVYGEKGFIQYTAEIQPEFHRVQGATEGIVDFKITIDEGRRFRIRKISFKGDDLAENELRQMLLLRDGDVYNQKLFEQSVSKINETGWFNRLDKEKDVDYRTNEEEGLLDLAIKVTRRARS
ncbi:MAG: POTRA domain-containing protein [Acidobacteriota bacterium]